MTKITTGLGDIEGVDLAGLLEFRGIRFAEAPVGERRFRPPVRTGSWEGTYDATQHPNRSVQMPQPPVMGPAGPGDPDEDCLFLNIVTPAADGARRPVICWIHGGAFTIGSANDYPAASWARGNDIVVVSVNYRLGMLGFLDLSGLDPSYVGSANLGIADQIAALEWIRDHIADFGGDPDNVTIAGESAGAMSVMSLLASPSADGLYHRAIANSSGSLRDAPQDIATLVDDAIPGDGALLDRLLAAPTDALLAAQLRAGFGFGGCIDGTVVTRTLAEGARNRSEAGVPLVIGSNADEGTLFLAVAGNSPEVFDMITTVLRGSVAGSDDKAQAYLDLVDAEVAEGDLVARNLQIWNDFFRRPAVEAAEAATAGGAGGWLYRFEQPSDAFDGALRAAHGSEIAFSFNWLSGTDPTPGFVFHEPSEANQVLADVWSKALVAFARTGDPNGTGLPDWPRYSAEDRQVLILDDPCRIDLDPDEARRKVWSLI